MDVDLRSSSDSVLRLAVFPTFALALATGFSPFLELPLLSSQALPNLLSPLRVLWLSRHCSLFSLPLTRTTQRFPLLYLPPFLLGLTGALPPCF